MRTSLLLTVFALISWASSFGQSPQGTYSYTGDWHGAPSALVLKLAPDGANWQASLTAASQDGTNAQPVQAAVISFVEADQFISLEIEGEVYEGTFAQAQDATRLILTGTSGHLDFLRF